MYTIVGLQDAGLYVQATIPPVLTGTEELFLLAGWWHITYYRVSWQ